MLTREDFDMWLNMLIEARGWRNMGDESRDIFLDQLNRYNPTLEDFGDYCAKIIDADYCQPNDLVRHFKKQYHEQVKQKALPAGAAPAADIHSDEFVRFVRMGRELRQAVAQGKSYPCGDWPSTQISPEFSALWSRPLTEEDYAYAEQRRQAKHMRVMDIDIPVGGGHA